MNRLLFIGESWYGSSARGLREALSRQKGIQMEDVCVDLTVPLFRSRVLRAVNRLLVPLELKELNERVLQSCEDFKPDVILVVKGWHFEASFIRTLRERYAPVVNVFPDPSPHIYGPRLKKAMGEYDLVIARNRHHPANWKNLYGYDNRCVHVTHAYFAEVHQCDSPPETFTHDVVMVATYRDEYGELVRDVVRGLQGRGVTFALCGSGWNGRGFDEIPGLTLEGVKPGLSYIDWLRRGRIVIAPVWTSVPDESGREPGDEVTGRTFQCAAAYTFFIHKRTEEIQRFYDEKTEVPMFDDGKELAEKILFYLDHEEIRRAMASAAHARAVPAYSMDARAAEIVSIIRDEVLG